MEETKSKIFRKKKIYKTDDYEALQEMNIFQICENLDYIDTKMLRISGYHGQSNYTGSPSDYNMYKAHQTLIWAGLYLLGRRNDEVENPVLLKGKSSYDENDYRALKNMSKSQVCQSLEQLDAECGDSHYNAQSDFWAYEIDYIFYRAHQTLKQAVKKLEETE